MKFFAETAELVNRQKVMNLDGIEQEEMTIKLTLRGNAYTDGFSTKEVLKIIKERLKEIKSEKEKVSRHSNLSFARDNVMSVIDILVNECDGIKTAKE